MTGQVAALRGPAHTPPDLGKQLVDWAGSERPGDGVNVPGHGPQPNQEVGA